MKREARKNLKSRINFVEKKKKPTKSSLNKDSMREIETISKTLKRKQNSSKQNSLKLQKKSKMIDLSYCFNFD